MNESETVWIVMKMRVSNESESVGKDSHKLQVKLLIGIQCVPNML